MNTLHVTRHALEDGYLIQERTTWTKAGTGGVAADDPRLRMIGDAGELWLLTQVAYPLVDIAAITRHFSGQIPPEHPYWQYYALPVRPGVQVISRPEYEAQRTQVQELRIK